jgi:hypothetical protein
METEIYNKAKKIDKEIAELQDCTIQEKHFHIALKM